MPTHSTKFFHYNDLQLIQAERISNGFACFPSFVAQKTAGAAHFAFGTMQFFNGGYMYYTGMSNQGKMRWQHGHGIQKKADWPEEDQAIYRDWKEMKQSGLGHLLDGSENMVRGFTEWALGKYAQKMRHHVPTAFLKRFPGALGGIVMFSVNYCFPKEPFNQVTRGWQS